MAPGHAPRRKTLEDIRRELDAEFPASPGIPAGRARIDLDDVVEPAVAAPPSVALERPRAAAARAAPWRGHVIAGAIGCIVGQLLILASFAATRYADDIVRVWAVVSASRPGAPVVQADDTPPALASTPPAGSPPDVASSPVVPAEPVEAPTITPPAAVAASLVLEPRGRAPTARRPATQGPPSAPPAPRRPLAGPGDWVQSQALLRSALSEWIALSGRSDVETGIADAEVILGADGSTAKTRVPVTSRAAVVVREQRWELGSDGWILVDERDIDRRVR